MPTVVGSIPFKRPASEALNTLPEPEQGQVLEALAGLADIPWAQWPADRLRRLPADFPLYLFRVNPELFVFLQPPNGQGRPTVVDVVRRETLANFSER